MRCMYGLSRDIWYFVSLISESLFECFQKTFTSANSNLIDFVGKMGACISGKTNGNEMTTSLKLPVKSMK